VLVVERSVVGTAVHEVVTPDMGRAVVKLAVVASEVLLIHRMTYIP